LNPLKKLASQTAIYGLPTIVGRLLNYLLTPLYTYNYNTTEFGVVTSAYSYVTLLLVLLTYGMETTLFKFSQSEPDKKKVYTTALISVLSTSSLFVLFAFLFSVPLSDWAKFDGHPEYVRWFAVIIAADALAAIPFAKLREQGKPKRFAIVRSISICINIGLNLFFIIFCKHVHEAESSVFKPFVESIYDPSIGVGYIFISNLISSLFTLVLLSPELLKFGFVFDSPLWKKLMRYSLPLLIAGMAGMVNETLDRLLLLHMLPDPVALSQTGIYGACYKISIIMTIFVQTFRFAAEPFFFSHAKEAEPQKMYAAIMNYFVIVCALIFLGTMMNISWISHFVGEDFRSGIGVVPILLLANLFLGIFYNQSIWYKLTAQTHYGALLTIFGAIITIVLNLYWIPRIGYMGCAWATLICYGSMMVASFFIGNKHYPVNYDLKRILAYLGLSVTLYVLSLYIQTSSDALNLVMNNLLLLGFMWVVWHFDGKKLFVKAAGKASVN
jgi:O-antigen/teichoic acid export membrane protein